MRCPRSTGLLLLAAATAAAALAVAQPAPAGAPGLLPPRFRRIDSGPDGGSVWQAPLPGWPAGTPRPTVVYLPPGATAAAARRYPVLYLLQGFPGSPYQYVDGLRLAAAADRAIASGAVRPFVAVIPPARPDAR